jgi:hypothetical protein
MTEGRSGTCPTRTKKMKAILGADEWRLKIGYKVL